MKSKNISRIACLAAVCGVVCAANAQSAQKPWLDANLPAEQRAAALVHQMTLEQKAT